ncbi:MAG TPA: hypothetical protein DFR83_25255 [Deltaproteobacteria bacterium]|nr:hypothetical protein [Deltaproteobacteria bacterium]
MLFLASCGGDTCHGADGSAGPATNLPNVIPFFNDPQLKSIITNGIGYMPPVGYTGTDLTDVVAYLRTTFP